ncbi:hypothetical protein DFH09DRAFT_393780 [Mycena vulgaris]|nr:hypothetical protein DFH09DRAFT_393780 [Mycena vulgaris]
MLPPLLPVQELLDHIIELIPKQADLKSIALASPSFCQTAQSLIFRHIVLHHDGDDNIDAMSHRRCQRLKHGLMRSPHLAKYIHSVSITIHDSPSTLLLLPSMGLVSLRTVAVTSFLSINGSLMPPLRKLLALPSVRRLQLSCGFWGRLFDKNKPHLTSLAFRFCRETSNGELARGPPRQQSIITQLALECASPSLLAWLTDPSCSFDFTHLEELEVVFQDLRSQSVRHLLECSRFTITRLTLSPPAPQLNDEAVDVTRYPNLTHLCIRSADIEMLINSTIPYISVLKRHAAIQSLTIRIDNNIAESDRLSDDKDSTVIEDQWLGLDTILAGLPFPALHEIIVLLTTTPNDPPQAERLFRQKLPLLVEKKLLSIIIEYD